MICFVEIRAAPTRRQDLIAFVKAWMPTAIRAGCTSVQLLTDVADADQLVLVESWSNAKAFQTFSRAELANEAQLARLRELTVGGLPTLRMFESAAWDVHLATRA